MEHRWFALWTLTGEEQKARAKLQGIQGIAEAIFLEEELWERHEGAWKKIRKALMPGYIFVRCVMTTTVYYAAREAPGVIKWLGKDDNLWPGTIPDSEMRTVLGLSYGDDPAAILADVEVNKRNRRGYGTLTLNGTQHKIPFNAYKQPDAPAGDTSPQTEEGEDSPEPDA